MQEKSFATCFDKNCEEFAELLMTLVSENPSICNINQKKDCLLYTSPSPRDA